MRIARLALAGLFTLAAPLHAADYQLGKLHMEQPSARPTRPGQPSGGAYVTIENRGASADRLISAQTPVAGRTEIHTMHMDGNVMRMREIGAIDIPAGSTVRMRPGEGYHLMLMELKQALKAGERFPLTLQFEKAGKIDVTVEVSDQLGSGHMGGHGQTDAPAAHRHGR